MQATLGSRELQGSAFRHEALFYCGAAEFVPTVLPPVRDAVREGLAVLVVTSRAKVDALRGALGRDATKAQFADMLEVGRNPARIIPVWEEFLAEHLRDGRPVLGVGEPIWTGRTEPELVECQRHEALLNVAFGQTPTWSLLCPYDVKALPPSVAHEARLSHPYVQDLAGDHASPLYRASEMADSHLTDPLPEPPRALVTTPFGAGRLGALRTLIATKAARFGLAASRTDDLVLCADEIATNSVRHGGGAGQFRLWRDAKSLVCEISDSGHIKDPLAGRLRPALDADGGRGLWMTNQLCDLVQIRSSEAGTVVRLHMAIDEA